MMMTAITNYSTSREYCTSTFRILWRSSAPFASSLQKKAAVGYSGGRQSRHPLAATIKAAPSSSIRLIV
jgi:hypothetical protein